MNLPDESSPKNGHSRPRRTKTFSEDNLTQQLHDASTHMQEQAEKLSQAISEQWLEGHNYQAATAAQTEAEAPEQTPAAQADSHVQQQAQTAEANPTPQNAPPAKPAAPPSYGKQDTLNRAQPLHPRFIWPD
jgi:hypothetical protein